MDLLYLKKSEGGVGNERRQENGSKYLMLDLCRQPGQYSYLFISDFCSYCFYLLLDTDLFTPFLNYDN